MLSTRSPCEGRLKALGYYRQQLYQRGVTRPSAFGRTLLNDWQAVREVARLHTVPIPAKVNARDVSCCKKCKTCPVDLKAEILEVVKQSKMNVVSLCLMCEMAAVPLKVGIRCNHKFAE